jgi:hypothetical protein
MIIIGVGGWLPCQNVTSLALTLRAPMELISNHIKLLGITARKSNFLLLAPQFYGLYTFLFLNEILKSTLFSSVLEKK